jgi:peptidoglycan/LPS O-acetylase OafA/YrhL
MGVDTFFLLSGFLLTTSILGALEKEWDISILTNSQILKLILGNFSKKINIFKLYLRRYLRIVPAFAAAILFTGNLTLTSENV